MKSFKSFEQLSTNYANLLHLFSDKTNYWAHTNKSKTNEKLHAHINKVQQYFITLVDSQRLEQVIDNLIDKIAFNNGVVGNYLKTFFLHSIVFHDFGKINPNFQVERLNNEYFTKDTKVKIGSNHSFLSAYLFLNYHIPKIYNDEKISRELKSISMTYAYLFIIPVLKHHSTFISKHIDLENEKIQSIKHLLSIFDIDPNFELVDDLIDKEEKLFDSFDRYVKNKSYDFFALFALLKLNFSLLTAADYYATFDYMKDMEFFAEDFGLIDEKLKKHIFHAFENSEEAPYNKDIMQKRDTFLQLDDNPLQEKNNRNLNLLRMKMGAETLMGIEKYANDRLFYIEAPTGGGKTNMSIIAVRKFLELHPEINKVFYVFPFTTLITQTTKSIKDTLNLDNTHVAQVHSKAGLQTKFTGEDNVRYGKDLRNQVDNLFVNFPFTLLTHVKFFDILKSNHKDTNYLLHRLANSVVIIDELQSYNPEHWDKVKYFIANYAELFNIRFLLMSATLPKIDEIALSGPNLYTFKSLLENGQERFLQNPNFAERVMIRTELMDKGKIELEELGYTVFKESEKYAYNRTDAYQGSVHTIVEFIFKNSTTEFYQELQEQNLFQEYEVFVLSGTIQEPRRKYIIEYLKDPENRKKKILLITTQVVEAGVDIDMDLGFKNQSLIDSDEQLAGRINRNVTKSGCELWLFNYNPARFIYGQDLRYEVTKNFTSSYINEILSNKRFDLLYNEVFEQIKQDNESVYKINFNDYKRYIERIDFQKIHNEFKLIDSENASIFVPVDVPVYCYKNVQNFSPQELTFIRDNNCFVDSNENKVSGESIWDTYVAIIQDSGMSYSRKSIELKILHGIIAKFVFSIFFRKLDDMKEYMDYNEEVADFEYFQYYKFRKQAIEEDDIYDYNTGMNEAALASGNMFL